MVNSESYPLEKEKANRQTVWEHYFARKIAFLNHDAVKNSKFFSRILCKTMVITSK